MQCRSAVRGIQIISFLFAFITVFVSAEISIQYPSKLYYLVAGQQNDVLWKWEAGDAATFSIYLSNPAIADLKNLALANNVGTNLNKTSVNLPESLANTGFQIFFTDIGNITKVYATSEVFEIKPHGTEPIAYVAPTPTPPPSDSPNSKGGGDASKQNSSNSIHDCGFDNNINDNLRISLMN
ncbi:2737_t:CDS:2 [Funneliformis geosporum]|uniref:2737_t:CDS:1 n=1 Tax=Funneliformis geosporum TaxID=1117311 RepID=A0A9W4SV18_9GLOM|nr:2737_t:CDS:2 [Funneliformis geosporum]